MSRYYFDLLNGGGPTRDENGVDLDGKSEVLHYMRRILIDLINDDLSGPDRGGSSLTVRDDTDKVIALAALSVNTQWIGENERLTSHPEASMRQPGLRRA